MKRISLAAVLLAYYGLASAETLLLAGDLKAATAAAQTFANAHRVEVHVWKLPKAPGEAQRWMALTINSHQPARATLERTVKPK